MDPQKTPPPSPDDRQDFHPEMTISPRTHDPSAPAVGSAETATPAPTEPAPPTDQAASVASPAPESTQDAPGEASFFNADGISPAKPPVRQAVGAAGSGELATNVHHDTGKEVIWTASEFIQREKGPMWYVILLACGLVLSGGAYLLSRDMMATLVTIAVVVIFGIGASRKPRQMQYTVNDQGIAIGARHFDYSLFRAYTIDVEDHFHSINLMPMKRFMPIISVYYALEDEERIVEVLSAHLPLDTHKADLVEKLMRKIRF